MPIPPADGSLTELAELTERQTRITSHRQVQVGAMRWVALLPACLENETRRHIPRNQGAAFSCSSFCDESCLLGQPGQQFKSHQASFFSLEPGQTSPIEDG